MKKRVLITGGAGFIGSHLADELLAHGHEVRVLDNLSPQVHGPGQVRPAYLSTAVELQVGDVRSTEDVRRALEGIDVVFHFAAMVGVGQSMYEVEAYTSVNTLGTAVLLQALLKKSVERLVVASSMSVYGEGFYRGRDGRARPGRERSLQQLSAGDWEVRDEEGEVLSPQPTPEWKAPENPSIYALSKYDQERMCLLIGKAYRLPTVALRFFNAYGTRQALSNPYTGVLAIFASRLLHGRSPLIFEDGEQMRDFVSVHDVARACRLSMESEAAAGQVLNVGSGEPMRVRDVAQRMAQAMGKPEVAPTITGKYRVGDVRHCYPDIGLARRVLGYEPRVTFEGGLSELTAWLREQAAALPVDRVVEARAELDARGLTL
ncbi:NAD-dependent epimerase/dehydratase family protein [Chondromyces apiculatus]|uniref:UDP-glucose 4-epimerase n=1 Tax=Chondromyces apiculatus DSM 436 TaxID=1192034 RepID=A0A017T1R5_9BACT|nr:NAD-dependent epimerase/dehydratase family protein [Chondromyces apiculatus]EYF03199.1 UDP-glucose 4-epimerase [Chondromyces apiculatus DSM 436]